MADINSAIRAFNRAGFNCTQNSQGITHVDSRDGSKHFTLVEHGNKESGTYDIGITGLRGIKMSEVLDTLPEDWSCQ